MRLWVAPRLMHRHTVLNVQQHGAQLIILWKKRKLTSLQHSIIIYIMHSYLLYLFSFSCIHSLVHFMHS